ncbi:AbrB family transcriptional regulator [Natranaerobius trueperi]|nr:AbrB family transcriptional regulator [Natranaerobius trueperi]
MYNIFGLLLLYSLGVLGWKIGDKLNIPAAPVLGGILIVGTLRIMGIDLPYLPDSIVFLLQIALGVMVGAKFDRDAFRSLRLIALPAIIISSWAVIITLLFGYIIAMISPLDIVTGILGSSIGGLPEMTILAHDTQADAITMVLFHVFRILATMMIFPPIIRYIQLKNKSMGTDNFKKSITSEKNPPLRIERLVLTFVAAGLFGGLLIYLGVPAGGLVGGLIFIVVATYLDIPIQVPPSHTLSWFLVGIGLMVSNQFSPETLELILSGDLIIPLLFSVVFTLGSSLLVSYGIYKLTGWDYIVCFLASAPAGFTVMTGLALKEGYDPIKVSLLHLSRLVTLKLVIPFLFMIFY